MTLIGQCVCVCKIESNLAKWLSTKLLFHRYTLIMA